MEQNRQKKIINNLTEGSPLRLLLLFSLPLMAGNIFQQFYTVVDTAVVGKVLGVETLAALGAVDWLNWLVLGIVQGFAQGFSILMAQRFGADDRAGLRRSVTNSIVLSVVFAFLLTGISEWAIYPILNLLRVPGQIQPIAAAYLHVMFAGTPIVMAYNFSSSVLRALGDGKTPLYAMIFASIVNISLDLLFVMGFGWGVEGAAAATVIAQLLSVIFCLMRIRKIEILKMCRDDWRIDAVLLGYLLKLGVPMAFQNTVIAVGGMILQTVVNTLGVTFIAGFTATTKLYGLLETAATAYGYAMVTYAGQNMGAGRIKRISDGMRAGLLISAVTSLMITGLMFGFGRIILGMFISTEAASGGQALEIAFHYLKIMSTFLPILYLLHISRSCIQGLGNTVLPMVSGIAEFVMRTGSAILLPKLFGAGGIFYAEILAWVGADLILVPSYFLVLRQVKRNRESAEAV